MKKITWNALVKRIPQLKDFPIGDDGAIFSTNFAVKKVDENLLGSVAMFHRFHNDGILSGNGRKSISGEYRHCYIINNGLLQKLTPEIEIRYISNRKDEKTLAPSIGEQLMELQALPEYIIIWKGFYGDGENEGNKITLYKKGDFDYGRYFYELERYSNLELNTMLDPPKEDSLGE